MLEVMEDSVICGVILYNDTWCDVYCDKYGVLSFDNYSDGVWCISEINFSKTMSLSNTRDIITNIKRGMYGECVGVIFGWDGDIAVLLDDNKAVMRRLYKPLEDVSKPFYYSTDEEYEP